MIGPNGRIFIFGFLSAIAPLSIDIYLPALPMLRQALAADEAQTLFTLSAFFIGFGVGQLLLGPLSDRFGRKRPLIAGLVLYIIASVACAEATTMQAIVASRFVQAFGGSVVPTIVQAMVRDLYDRNQSARILSLNMLVTASAPVVAPLIGGQVLLWLDLLGAGRLRRVGAVRGARAAGNAGRRAPQRSQSADDAAWLFRAVP
jgi:DHA1 family bicyclomycin/chloramphenicol resistance-like MFS transporter